MKTNFTNSLIRYLLEKEYYNLISADNMTLDFSSGHVSLIRDFQGTSVLLEIIDADKFSCEQLSVIMENGAVMIKTVDGKNASVFKVFLFNEAPEEEKISIIEHGQLDIIDDRKFLKCLSIDISSKTIKKLFSVPAFDANLVRAVNRFFTKKLDVRATTPKDIQEILEQRKKDFEIHLKAKKPWLTYILILINVAVWGALKLISIKTNIAYDNLLEPYGAKVNSRILAGEYWRFLTPMFLHGDEVHLALNCYSLYIVGSQVEKLFGRVRFSAIYFVAGFLGCVASFSFSINTSIGASGAIFGLMGAMLYFTLKRPSLLKSSFGANLITTLVINLAYGYMNTRIDNYGHLGGLIGGFLTTGVVYTAKEKDRKDRLRKIAAFILVIAVSVGGVFYGFNNKLSLIVPKLDSLQTYFDQKNYVKAESLAEEILELKPSEKKLKISVLWNLAFSESFQKKYEESIVHAAQLVDLSPADGRYVLGINYYYTGEFEKAKQELLAAKQLGSPNEDTIDLLIADIEKRTTD